MEAAPTVADAGPDTGSGTGLKVAIMQPYFFPYIGYFQLVNAVDLFIVYDNIKYTKKGWINRNRFLQNDQDCMFSLPLKSDSDMLDIVERELAADFNPRKLLQQLSGAYRRAPYFAQTLPLLEAVLLHDDKNLFRFLEHALRKTCAHLGIATEFKVSSTIPIAHELKGKHKVMAMCQAVGAHTYVNAIGGMDLYEPQEFSQHGLELKFIRSKPFEYAQAGADFVPWLSIIDVMMFNPPETIQSTLDQGFDLI
ncbi:WbqC family protein [Undibacterium sp. TC4M20W]|uniref:WbqC family protein n=1 Tax=unclassified Undibacterium TaxID=2630295 RepID=UPI003BF10EBE